MIIVNFKEYTQSTGNNATLLSQICEEVSIETGVEIAVCPSAFDIGKVRESVNIRVYAQHIDNILPGAYTGFLSANHLKSLGANGTLLNHSEHKIGKDVLSQTLDKTNEFNLEAIVCVIDLKEAEEVLPMNPYKIALEIPELIAGDISISKADPQIIKDAVSAIGSDKLIIGSGIKTADDVKATIDLGAKGIILASGFDLAQNAKYEILNLANAFI